MKPISRAQANRVRGLLAEYLQCQPDEIFMAGHDHEGLTPGAWSFAYEYDTELLAQATHDVVPGSDFWFERINGFALALYRK
jgi:hypothetical protein